MALTKQQQNVIDTVKNNDGIVKVQACAGSGKTFTLVELAKELKPKSGLYIAYNKAIADEAVKKFKGTSIECSTIHSLAYNAVVRQYGLNVGYFGVSSVVPTTLHYKDKVALIASLEKFFLSAHTDPSTYLDEIHASTKDRDLFWHHLNGMSNGEISCPHSFYLKLYHIFLADGTLPVPTTDILLVDEAGDLTELTIELFKIIKAPKKVAVGDPMQNIYSFNNTVNAFKVLKDEGIQANLTESFRVSSHIAKGIQAFVHKYMDKDFEFIGHEYPKGTEVITTAYIARTNTGLIPQMFHCMENEVPFHTTRKIDQILELPLILANLGNGKPITEHKYKHIEKLRKQWEQSANLQQLSTINSYVSKNLKDDEEAKSAIRLVHAHGPTDLNKLAKYARECAKSPCSYTFTTAHSSKGLEWDQVEIAPDLNDAVVTALVKIAKAKMSHNNRMVELLQEELRLYYVATSRCKIDLLNARHLPKS